MKNINRLISMLGLTCLVLYAIPLNPGMAQVSSPQGSAASVPQRFDSSGVPVAVTAEIVAANPQVASPMQYSVTIDAPRGTTVVLPPIAGVSINEIDKLAVVDQSLGDFLLTEVELTRDLPTGDASGTRRTRLLLKIESLKAGIRKVPPLEVVYRLGDEQVDNADSTQEGTVTIPALGIEIGSVLVADDTPEKFRDIKTAVATTAEEPVRTSPMLALGFVGAGALFLGWFWWACRGRCVKPEQWAFQRISGLEQMFDSSQIRLADVYGDLSVVLRDYVQSAYNTPATALCTSEFVDLLRREGLDATVISAAQSILSTADVSKFGPGAEVLGEESQSPFERARSVVEEIVRLQSLTPQRRSGAGTSAVHADIETAQKVEA